MFVGRQVDQRTYVYAPASTIIAVEIYDALRQAGREKRDDRSRQDVVRSIGGFPELRGTVKQVRKGNYNRALFVTRAIDYLDTAQGPLEEAFAVQSWRLMVCAMRRIDDAGWWAVDRDANRMISLMKTYTGQEQFAAHVLENTADTVTDPAMFASMVDAALALTD